MRPLTRGAALAVLAAALAARLAYVAVDGKGEAERGGDAGDYHAYASALVETGEYRNEGGDRASRMPGYPLLLAAQYAALGRSPLLTQLVQCLLGALTCVLVAALAARWCPPPWPLAAGLLAAASFDLIEPCARLLTEAPAALALTAALWLLHPEGALSPRRAAAAGAAGAAGYLLRPELLPWCLAGALQAAARARAGARASCAAAALAAPLLAAAAWGGRNAAALGSPVVTTTAGAFNLYGWGIPRTVEERLGGPRWERAPETDPELSRRAFYAGRARRYFREAPLAEIARAAALNVALLYYPFAPALDATFVFLAPLALLGAWAARRGAERRLLWLTPLYFTAVYALAGVMIPRHRQTYGGLIVLLATLGLHGLRSRLGPRAFAAAAGGWGAACAGAWAAGPFLREAVLRTRDALLRGGL